MGIFGGILDAVGGFVGGALSYRGAKKANEMNMRLAREQMNFQRASTREQMAFQERMSNTAYQRAVQDMSAAGINPILAFNQGGASAPSGASSSGAMAEVTNELGGAVSSAIAARSMAEQINNLRSQTKLNEALMRASKEDAALKAASAVEAKSDTVRSWLDTAGGTIKDLVPWLLLFLKRGRI